MKKFLFAAALVSFLPFQEARSIEPITAAVGTAFLAGAGIAIKNNKHCEYFCNKKVCKIDEINHDGNINDDKIVKKLDEIFGNRKGPAHFCVKKCNGGEETIYFPVSKTDVDNKDKAQLISVNVVKLYRKGSSLANCVAAYKEKHPNNRYSSNLIGVRSNDELALLKRLAITGDYNDYLTWIQERQELLLPKEWDFDVGKVSNN